MHKYISQSKMMNYFYFVEQNEAAIDFPVHLSIDAAGMVWTAAMFILVFELN